MTLMSIFFLHIKITKRGYFNTKQPQYIPFNLKNVTFGILHLIKYYIYGEKNINKLKNEKNF